MPPSFTQEDFLVNNIFLSWQTQETAHPFFRCVQLAELIPFVVIPLIEMRDMAFFLRKSHNKIHHVFFYYFGCLSWMQTKIEQVKAITLAQCRKTVKINSSFHWVACCFYLCVDFLLAFRK